jgi:hypothetical protein
VPWLLGSWIAPIGDMDGGDNRNLASLVHLDPIDGLLGQFPQILL